jgi:hypothetical protein
MLRQVYPVRFSLALHVIMLGPVYPCAGQSTHVRAVRVSMLGSVYLYAPCKRMLESVNLCE